MNEIAVQIISDNKLQYIKFTQGTYYSLVNSKSEATTFLTLESAKNKVKKTFNKDFIGTVLYD